MDSTKPSVFVSGNPEGVVRLLVRGVCRGATGVVVVAGPVCGTQLRIRISRKHAEEFQRAIAELRDRFRVESWSEKEHADALRARIRAAVRQVSTPHMQYDAEAARRKRAIALGEHTEG